MLFARTMLLALPSWLAAQAPHVDSGAVCRRLDTKTSLRQLTGQRIGMVRIETNSATMPVIGSVTEFGGSSREAVVRRQLLFAAGDSVDTLRIAETLRRLRQERVFADVDLVATQCDATDVDLVVKTQDAWTLRPEARVLPPNTFLLGLEDRNLLGSGRNASVSLSQTAARRGGSMTLGDPWIGGRYIAGDMRLINLGAVYQLRASLRNHETSVYDPWNAEMSFERTTREPTPIDNAEIHTLGGYGLVGHRIHSHAKGGVVFLLLGAEFDSASNVPAAAADSAAFPAGGRRFIGADVGLRRRAASFDTLSWFVPGLGILDVPTAYEGDAVLGLGEEQVVRTPAAHFDSWIGRMWIPREGTLFVTDGWFSSFAGSGVQHNRVLRVVLSGYQHATWGGGYWGGRFMDENMSLTEADVRTRSLVTPAFDPTVAAVPLAARIATHATVGSIERMFSVASVGKTAVVDGGVFGAASFRADIRSDSLPYSRMGVAVAGARIRVLTSTGTTISTRIDLGYPVGTTAYVRRRPYFSISVGPLFDIGRRRDGARFD